MNDASWDRLTDAIDATLGITDHGRTKEPLPDRADLSQSIEYFEFTRAGEDYRLERSTGPAVVDRKSHYSRRGGDASRMEYIYDTSDTAHKVTLSKRSGEGWEPIDLHQLGL